MILETTLKRIFVQIGSRVSFFFRAWQKKKHTLFWLIFVSDMAPGEVNCPALQVGAHVIAEHSCTSAPSVAETVCSFSCLKGYKLSGPSLKQCQIDGTWTDQGLPVECDGKFNP